MCNAVSNAVTNVFVTQPQRNGNPDPTRPDPSQYLLAVACGVCGQDRIRSNGDLRAVGFGAMQ